MSPLGFDAIRASAEPRSAASPGALVRRIVAPALVAAVACLAAVTFAGTKATGTWAAPDLAPHAYKKVAVLAKISDDLTRRVLEDAVVAGLKQQGIDAVPCYETFSAADLASREAVEAKAAELGVDAGLVFSVTDMGQQVKSGPNVHANVGVPVRAGPFSVFLGTSVPLGGGTSVVKKYGVKAEFHATDSDGPRWIGNYTTDLKGGAERTAEEVASQTLKQLKKARLFSK